VVAHDRAVVILDLVKEAGDLGAADRVDLARSKLGEQVPLEYPTALLDAIGALLLTGEVPNRLSPEPETINILVIVKVIKSLDGTLNGCSTQAGTAKPSARHAQA